MMKTQPIANTIVRHSTSSPVALKTISRRVPVMLRQIQRIQAVVTQAQPMMVMNETYSRMPADEAPRAAVEGDRQRLAVRAEIGWRSTQHHPGQNRLKRNADELQ